MTIKETIADCVAKKRKFSVMTNMYTFLDAIVYDIDSDPDAVHILCKFNTSALTDVEPTFGSIQHSSGLQEVIVPYNQIAAVTCLDVSETLLQKFEETYPAFYEQWKNANKVEGVSWDSATAVKTTKSKAVQEYEAAHPKTLYKAIATGVEDGVIL